MLHISKQKNHETYTFLAVLGLAIGFGLNAQNVTVPQLGGDAPSFKAKSTEGVVKFPGDYGNKWKILLSHPKDFTPVCSSEILDLAKEKDQFDKLGAQLVVVSADVLDQHYSWKAAMEEIAFEGDGPYKVDFPLVDDSNHKISKLYGMMHMATSDIRNIRGVFFVDPDNKIKSIQFYPMEVGRSTGELIRTLQALQKTYAQNNLATPVNWKPGDDLIVTVLSETEKQNLNSIDSPYYQKAWFLTYKKFVN